MRSSNKMTFNHKNECGIVDQTQKSKYCSDKCYRSRLEKCNSSPQLLSYGLNDRVAGVSKVPFKSHIPSIVNYPSGVKAKKKTRMSRNNILTKYGKPKHKGDIVTNTRGTKYKQKRKNLPFVVSQSASKHHPRNSISLKDVVSRAQVNDFNGLELSDPVVQIRKSFKTSIPEPDNDFFDKSLNNHSKAIE